MKVKEVIKRLEAEGWRERHHNRFRNRQQRCFAKPVAADQAKGRMEMMVVLDAPQANIGTDAVAKDPFTRLLDLTLGWGEYVEKDEAAHPDGVQSADLYDAHQSIATFAEPYWDAAPEVQEMAVRHFVDTRLLPLLLGKAKP